MTLAKRGTSLPTLPKDPVAKKQVSTLDPPSSNVSKSVPINPKPPSDVFIPPLNFQYHPFGPLLTMQRNSKFRCQR